MLRDRPLDARVLRTGRVTAWLILLVLWSGYTAGARESDRMPGEQEARWPMCRGERFHEDQVIVKSLKTHEDRLYVNEEPFILTHHSSIVDERGRRLRPGSLWVGWLVELRYRTAKRSETSPYGPDEKVLLQMRVLERLPDPDEEDW